MVAGVRAEGLVVFGALFGDAENVVGFADLDEAG